MLVPIRFTRSSSQKKFQDKFAEVKVLQKGLVGSTLGREVGELRVSWDPIRFIP